MEQTEALTQIRALCDSAPWDADIDRLADLVGDVRAILDAVSVDATPAQGIARDALFELLWDWRAESLKGVANGASTEQVVDAVLALVRPVGGVTLTPEEARLAHSCALGTLVAEDVDPEAVPDLRALAARLETSS